MSRRHLQALARQVRQVEAAVPVLVRTAATADASTLGGQPASAFATSDHRHAGLYAPAQPPVYALAARPAASAELRGTIVLVEAAGADDVAYVCRRTAGGTYEWLPIGF